MAPGRDVPPVEGESPNQQNNINSAIMGGMPQGGVTPFAGAQQTIGAGNASTSSGADAAPTADPGATSYAPPSGNTGVSGGIGNPMGTPTPAEAPQAPAPSPYQAKGPAMGLEGFDAGKMQSGHISPKYVFAKHAQGLGVKDRDELMRRLQADESGYFKNASWGGSKGDILQVGGQLDPKFEGVSQFDVIRAMGEGGKGWQWGGIDPNGGGGAAAPAGIGSLHQGFGNGQLPPELLQMAIRGQLPGAAPAEESNSQSERLRAQIMGALQGGNLGKLF
jgi:hypothetical protein